jgi:hypothetical protein
MAWWFRVTKPKGKFLPSEDIFMVYGALEMMMINLEEAQHEWTAGEAALIEKSLDVLYDWEDDSD